MIWKQVVSLENIFSFHNTCCYIAEAFCALFCLPFCPIKIANHSNNSTFKHKKVWYKILYIKGKQVTLYWASLRMDFIHLLMVTGLVITYIFCVPLTLNYLEIQENKWSSIQTLTYQPLTLWKRIAQHWL